MPTATRAKAIAMLNDLNLGAQKEKLGDAVMRQGVAVANAAAAPTKAELDALLTSLRNAGLIAT